MYRGFQIGITVECMGWWSWFCQTSCHPTWQRYSPPESVVVYICCIPHRSDICSTAVPIYIVFRDIWGDNFLCSVLWHCWLDFRKSIRSVKIEWWGACMVIWLDWGADNFHTVQLMPLPPCCLLLHWSPDWFNLSRASSPRLSCKRGHYVAGIWEDNELYFSTPACASFVNVKHIEHVLT